jgi:hypothetical protein
VTVFVQAIEDKEANTRNIIDWSDHRKMQFSLPPHGSGMWRTGQRINQLWEILPHLS